MAAGCHPGFDRSTGPENPTLEPNLKWIGWLVAEIRPFELRHITRGAFGTPILRERGRRGHWSCHWNLERAMVVSYRLSIVTIALSLTIQPQFAMECLRVRSLWSKILRCSLWTRSMMLGSAKSENPITLSNREIICEEFQPYVITIPQRRGQTDRRLAVAISSSA